MKNEYIVSITKLLNECNDIELLDLIRKLLIDSTQNLFNNQKFF